MVRDRGSWCTAVHGVTKSWTRLSNWTTMNAKTWINENENTNLTILHNPNILYCKQTGGSHCCPCMELDDYPYNWSIAPLIPATSKPAFCLEPKVTGGCNAMMSRYSYNTQIRLCKQFVYGGCEGNGNNFEKLEDCMKTCSQEAGFLW